MKNLFFKTQMAILKGVIVGAFIGVIIGVVMGSTINQGVGTGVGSIIVLSVGIVMSIRNLKKLNELL